MKLGKRLQALFDTISNATSHATYDEIWDCCCDHGLLGMEILNRDICQQVHFVDMVADITRKLEQNLNHFSANTYTITTGSAANIQLNTANKQLIILAGISGRTVISIMKGIIALNHPLQELTDNKQIDISYLISPNYHLYEVREYLIQQGFYLVSETIVFENNKSNEIILVSTKKPKSVSEKANNLITPTGKMWEHNDQQHQNYLNSLIDHYQKKYDGGGSIKIKRILAEYKQLRSQ